MTDYNESYPQRRIKRWSDEAIEAAARSKGPGTYIVWSDENTLLLDLDGGEEGVRVFKSQLALLEETLPIDTFGDYIIRPSRSGKNYHVTLKLVNAMPVQNRILLQALLGSDIKREALSFAGLINGQPNPIVFFEKSSGGAASISAEVSLVPDYTEGELDKSEGAQVIDLMAALKASLAKGK